MLGSSLAKRVGEAITRLLSTVLRAPYLLVMSLGGYPAAGNQLAKSEAVQAGKVPRSVAMDVSQPAPSGVPLTDLARETILGALCYLSAADLSAASVSSRIMLLLVAEVQRKPGIVTEIGPPNEVLTALKRRLTATPTIGFLLGTGDLSRGSVAEVLSKGLPQGCHVIGANSPQLQALVQTEAATTELRHLQTTGQVTLMLGSFPDAVAKTFHLDMDSCAKICEGGLSTLQQRGLPVGEEWKTIVLMVGDLRSGSLDPNMIVQAFQRGSSNTAILGGVAGEQVLLHSRGRTVVREEGIVGLALKGEVPLTALVSRGCIPLTPVMHARGAKVLTNPDAEGEEVKALKISELVSEECGVSSPLNTAIQTQDKARSSGLFVGVRLQGEGGFLLEQVGQQNFQRDGSMQLPFMGTKEQEEQIESVCDIRYYSLTPDACKTDVERLLGYVRQQCEEGNEETLGAVMFTCGARTKRFFGEEFLDAKKFQSVFPSLPLIGFWAGGEIGPQAVAEATVVEATRAGHACFQGFTAVFGIFRAPVHRAPSALITLSDEEVPAAVGALLKRWASEAKDRGNSAFKEGTYSDAKVHYTRALALSSLTSVEALRDERATLFANRAMALLKDGDAENALVDAEATLEIDPLHAKGLYRRGQALLALGRAKEAASVLREAASQIEGNLALKELLAKAERAAAK